MAKGMCIQARTGEARASFAYMFRIEVDGELFLIGNEHPEKWRYQPVGGGYCYFSGCHEKFCNAFSHHAAPTRHKVPNSWLKGDGSTDPQEAIRLSAEEARRAAAADDAAGGDTAGGDAIDCSVGLAATANGDESSSALRPSVTINNTLRDLRLLVPAARMAELFEWFCSAEDWLYPPEKLDTFEYASDPDVASIGAEIERRERERLAAFFDNLVTLTADLALTRGELDVVGCRTVEDARKILYRLGSELPPVNFPCQREVISDLSREFIEELLNSHIITPEDHKYFPSITYEYLGYTRDIFYDERFCCFSFFMADVLDLKLTESQLEVFRRMKKRGNPNWIFIPEKEIHNHLVYRHESPDCVPFPPIADHTAKILRNTLRGGSFYRRCRHRLYKVKLFDQSKTGTAAS